MRPSRLLILALLASCALLHTGCAPLLHSTLKIQQVTVVADDDDTYDFYVNGVLKCENTSVCDVYRSTLSRCQMTIEAVRDKVVLGTEKYGYWDEPNFIDLMFRDKEDEEKENKCPEGFFRGASAVVTIDKELKERVHIAREKAWTEKSNASWETSPLSSSSGE